MRLFDLPDLVTSVWRHSTGDHRKKGRSSSSRYDDEMLLARPLIDVVVNTDDGFGKKRNRRRRSYGGLAGGECLWPRMLPASLGSQMAGLWNVQNVSERMRNILSCTDLIAFFRWDLLHDFCILIPDLSYLIIFLFAFRL